jgi:MSHA biogenesis protein MshN
VSLINKMLQDLDRRNAMASAAGQLPPQQVRAVRAAGSGHEWFWRVIALLVLIAFAWVGWVFYQMQPQPLATDLAFSAGEAAQRKTAAAKVAPKPAEGAEKAAQAQTPAPAPVAEVAPAPAKESVVVAPAPQPAPPPELFKLALAIDTPIKDRPKPAVKAAQAAPSKPSSAPTVSSVNKRDRAGVPADEAEALFRHGVALLNQSRITEAQQEFQAALFRHPQHEAARQALLATRIERRQIDDARRLLEDGLALNPEHTQFATVLARVHVDRGDYKAAAGVLTIPAEIARKDPDYQVVLGAVLQRLGQHVEAAEALDSAARSGRAPAVTWIALGISFEAVGRRADAVQSYKRSLSGPLAPEARSYAEGRIRTLE